MFRAMKSGKVHRNEGNKGPENHPLISPLRGDEEELTKVSPQIPPPLTPPPASPPSPTSSPVPPPPPLQFSMENMIKFPMFKGLGNEDPD